MGDYKRPDFDRYYIEIAKSVSARSTCLRRRYGAVLVKNNKIVATGYNGSAAGEINCSDCGKCVRKELNVESGTRYELCLHGDTLVKLTGQENVTIKQLAEKQQEINLYAYDVVDKKIVFSQGYLARKTGNRNDLVEVILDNNTSFKCTKTHRVLMETGQYKRAHLLHPSDALMTIDMPRYIKRVDPVEGNFDVYDITVPLFHNFAITLNDSTDIFVHNCVSVHAEANALLSASADESNGATLYISGYNYDDNSIAYSHPCMMCARIIKNAKIANVIVSGNDDSIVYLNVNEL